MKQHISVSWKDGMAFEGKVDGHKIILDAGQQFGGRNLGPKPKSLMMVALAGCTAMDVVSILSKMRVGLENFDVGVEGELSEGQPVHYTGMHIVYEFWGKDLPIEKLEKAINLSHERYCGVLAVYRKAMPVTHSIIVHDTAIV